MMRGVAEEGQKTEDKRQMGAPANDSLM